MTNNQAFHKTYRYTWKDSRCALQGAFGSLKYVEEYDSVTPFNPTLSIWASIEKFKVHIQCTSPLAHIYSGVNLEAFCVDV